MVRLDEETFAEQFSMHDLLIIILGILLLFALAYAVIKFDIVPQDVFIEGTQKYNATLAQSQNNQDASGTAASAPTTAKVFMYEQRGDMYNA